MKKLLLILFILTLAGCKKDEWPGPHVTAWCTDHICTVHNIKEPVMVHCNGSAVTVYPDSCFERSEKIGSQVWWGHYFAVTLHNDTIWRGTAKSLNRIP
jgi:hypothetical protein